MEEQHAVQRADTETMTYRRLGEGPTVICLAGGPGADARYLEDLAGLDRRFELVIPDMRGTGGSAPAATPAGYGFDQLAEDVEVLRTHLGEESTRILAHSAACATALVYAAAHADRVHSLVLVAPSRVLYDSVVDDTGDILARRAAEPWYPAVMAATKRLADGPNPDDIPALLTALAPASYARWGEREQAHAALMEPVDWTASRHFWDASVDGGRLRAELGAVTAPVLAVTGGRDAAVGVKAGVAWAAVFPNGRNVTITSSGHHPWVDEPAVFVDLVGAFLA